jgi:hypothetical protein
LTSDNPNETDYQYCSVYVDYEDVRDLQSQLASLLEGEDKNFGHIALNGVTLVVRENEYRQMGALKKNDVVQWPAVIECESSGEPEDRMLIGLVSKILEELWGSDRRAVASCDFEDELPWGGGIRRIKSD